jgi:hypothetical protein
MGSRHRRAPGCSSLIYTIFLNKTASGGVDSVIDGVGGSSTAAKPDTPVDVVSHP